VGTLTDFGLARVYQASRISGLTIMNEMAGTPAFMAPEQITDFREARPATDLYSVGATLYNLLTDRYLFDFPNRLDQRLLMILQSDPVPIRARRPEIPLGLATAIHRSLAKEPEGRFASAGAMRNVVSEFREGA
jgi:serine/threonine-protein kinase